MIRAGIAALLTLAFAGDDGAKQAAQRPPITGTITFHEQIIIVRTPAGGRPVNAAAPAPAAAASANAMPIRWEEHRGPRCIAWAQIAGAGRLGQDSVDLVFRDNTRVRARLKRHCPALDYYAGFYMAATPDGLICADRDSIRARTGGECRIDRFRSLRAARAR
ncbi:MAG: hypothetical protein JO276_09970 [Sphingomonadaceae bacterium]|nr:hypothetical protein [Sphingomonadaceae bacterium]